MAVKIDMNIGLVLSGGGAKGAYEAGVIAALWDLGLSKNISVVSGTSIGVANALMFCMDDREMVEECWKTLNYSQFMTFQDLLKNKVISKLFKLWRSSHDDLKVNVKNDDQEAGIVSQETIREFVKKYIDMAKLKKTKIQLYGCAFNVNHQEPVYFHLNDYSEEEIIDISIASCAIPHVFSPISINGESYVDGGYHNPFEFEYKVDNVPLKPLVENHECDVIIIVHLDYLDDVDYKLYPNKVIIEVFPSVPLELMNGMGTLNLFQDTIHKRLDLGYRDAMVTLAPLLMAYIRGEDLEPYLKIHREKNLKLLQKHKPRPLEFIRFIQTENPSKKGRLKISKTKNK